MVAAPMLATDAGAGAGPSGAPVAAPATSAAHVVAPSRRAVRDLLDER